MFKRAQLEIKEILFLVAVHQSPPNSNASTGDFGRHINLHLTYSFQHQQQHHHGQQPPQLSPATCKSPTPSIYHNHGENIHSFPLLHVRKIHFFFFFMKNSSLYRSTVMNLDSNWQLFCILNVKRDFDEMKKFLNLEKGLFSIERPPSILSPGSEQSMDELSQDSMMLSMPNEV